MSELTFLGHSGFQIIGNTHTLVIDPFLNGNPLATAKPEEIKADYVLITHGHGDHLGDSVEIAKNNDATIIATYELAGYCEAKGAKVHPMHIGGGHNFDFGRVKLTIAHHGSSTPDGAYMGEPSGMLVNMDGKTLYHAGDTGLFMDMQLIGELNDIDLAILPIGDNFTMGIDDAVIAATFLKAGAYLPMHYKTFDLIDVDPTEFVTKLAAQGMEGAVLDVGESMTI